MDGGGTIRICCILWKGCVCISQEILQFINIIKPRRQQSSLPFFFPSFPPLSGIYFRSKSEVEVEVVILDKVDYVDEVYFIQVEF